MKKDFLRLLVVAATVSFIFACGKNSSLNNSQTNLTPPKDAGDRDDQEQKVEPPFKKVFIVIFENEDASASINQPYFAKLAKAGAYMNNLAALTHPSQPNYVALTSGDLNGVSGNGNVNLAVPNIVDLLVAKNKTWKTYQEDYPGNCFTGDKGKYKRKHNPFISYNSVRTNPEQCKNIVNASELMTDIKNGTLPDFSFYVPNMDNNGHDTNVAFASQWLEKTFDPIIKDPNFIKDMLFIATFDEDSGTTPNKIYTAFYGPGVLPGTVSNKPYTLYSILRTVEDGFALGTLGKKDLTASPINDVWK